MKAYANASIRAVRQLAPLSVQSLPAPRFFSSSSSVRQDQAPSTSTDGAESLVSDDPNGGQAKRGRSKSRSGRQEATRKELSAQPRSDLVQFVLSASTLPMRLDGSRSMQRNATRPSANRAIPVVLPDLVLQKTERPEDAEDLETVLRAWRRLNKRIRSHTARNVVDRLCKLGRVDLAVKIVNEPVTYGIHSLTYPQVLRIHTHIYQALHTSSPIIPQLSLPDLPDSSDFALTPRLVLLRLLILLKLDPKLAGTASPSFSTPADDTATDNAAEPASDMATTAAAPVDAAMLVKRVRRRVVGQPRLPVQDQTPYRFSPEKEAVRLQHLRSSLTHISPAWAEVGELLVKELPQPAAAQ